MANHCYNHMTIEVNKESDFNKLIEFFNSYKNYDTFSEWGDSLNDGFIPKDYNNHNEEIYPYGTRWWDFEVEATQMHLGSFEGNIDVYGDSAWAPPLGIAELISKAFNCDVFIEFSEPGMDFAGIYTYVNGDLSTHKDYSYNEYQYLECDAGYAFEQIIELINEGHYNNDDDLREDIHYMSDLDVKELVEIFNKV